MTPNDILSLIAHIAYMGLSVYAVVNPEAKWAGPAATALASVTRTPQKALGESKVMNTKTIKSLSVIVCAVCSLYAIANG